MVSVQLANRAKEESVACHCVIGACAGENQSVVTTERRDHDRDRHDGRAAAGENDVGCFGGDAIARRILNRGEWQGGEIGYVRQQIETDHQNRSERQ